MQSQSTSKSPLASTSSTGSSSGSGSGSSNPRQNFTPCIYTPSSSQWTPLYTSTHPTASLPCGTTLSILSWNIDMSYSSHSARMARALDYFTTLLPTHLPPTILMFQEMTHSSLTTILANPWVRSNFVISNKTPPSSSHYFTLLLVSKDLQTGDWLRVDFRRQRISMMGRDVVAVDVLVAENGPSDGGGGGEVARGKTKCVRIGTTHLESLGEEPGFELRPQQLVVISQLLKERPAEEGKGVEIMGGLVGGDMNSISELDLTSHKRDDVGLRDVWEEGIDAFGLNGEDGKEGDGDGDGSVEDASFGAKEGHTWGYQPRSRWPPIRLDKFFVTGHLQVVKLKETEEDSSGDIRRLGVGMKTESGLWVSDHFGIAVGIKVL